MFSMQTIAYQKRSDELNEKQPELHPETYKELMEFASENDGFTVCNIVNEALAQFLAVGDLASTQALVEERLRSKNVPLPKASISETQKKISQVESNEKSWNQVFDFHTVDEWKTAKDEVEGVTLKLADGEEKETDDYTIYLNTNFELWDAVSETPSYRSYIVNAAVEWWFDSPFNGSCDHILSLQQLLAVAEGETVTYDEATEWVQRRMDKVRKESDGEHHDEWEALFDDDAELDSSGMDVEDIRVHHEVEITEEEAIEARNEDKFNEGANRAGVLRAVMRSKDRTTWSREEVEKLNEKINGDMQTQVTKDGYVDTVMESLEDMVEFGASELVDDIKESIIDERGPSKGETTSSGHSKRLIFREDNLTWIDDVVGEELKEEYPTIESLGGNVAQCVADVVEQKERDSAMVALALINETPQKAWEAEGLTHETNAKDLEMYLNELDFVHHKVCDVCEELLDIEVEKKK